MSSYLGQSLIHWHKTCCECMQPCPSQNDMMFPWQLCPAGLLGPLIAACSNIVYRVIAWEGIQFVLGLMYRARWTCGCILGVVMAYQWNQLKNRDCLYMQRSLTIFETLYICIYRSHFHNRIKAISVKVSVGMHYYITLPKRLGWWQKPSSYRAWIILKRTITFS